jgi:Holliday junction resolvasome RuvABC endonuclease subunit
MLCLGLDISTKTGWALIEDKKLKDYGLLTVKIEDFNVQKEPNKSPFYPNNILKASKELCFQIRDLITKVKPDLIVIEQTVKGRNRHTQRCLEWFHKDIVEMIMDSRYKFVYVDPSEWRKVLGLRLNPDQKKNNKLVSAGKKRGRITPKHLSVTFINSLFGSKFKIKDNNITDAINLCLWHTMREEDESK